MTQNIGRSLSPFPDRETARSWPEIQTMFTELARTNPAFEPLSLLVHHLAHSDFVKAGLCAGTSMHAVVVGPSAFVFQNPHLRLEYDFDATSFRMIYVDGSPEPWARTVASAEIVGAVERFLVKRARWYRAQ